MWFYDRLLRTKTISVSSKRFRIGKNAGGKTLKPEGVGRLPAW